MSFKQITGKQIDFSERQFGINGEITIKNLPNSIFTVGSAKSIVYGKAQYSSINEAYDDFPPAGKVNFINLIEPGSGYLPGETLTLLGGNNMCFIKVDATDMTGAITDYHQEENDISEGYSIRIYDTTSIGSGSGATFFASTCYSVIEAQPDYNNLEENFINSGSTIRAFLLFSSKEMVSLTSNIDCDFIICDNLKLRLENTFLRAKRIFKESSTPYSVAIEQPVSGSNSIIAGEIRCLNSANAIDVLAGTLNINNSDISVANGCALRQDTSTSTTTNNIIVKGTMFHITGVDSGIKCIDSGDSDCTTTIYGGEIENVSSSINTSVFNMRGGTVRLYGTRITNFTTLFSGTSGTLELYDCPIEKKLNFSFNTGVKLIIHNNDMRFIYNSQFAQLQTLEIDEIDDNSSGIMYIWIKAFYGGGGAPNNMVGYVRYDGDADGLSQPTVKLLTDTEQLGGGIDFFGTTKDQTGRVNIYFEDGKLKIQNRYSNINNTIADMHIKYIPLKR